MFLNTEKIKKEVKNFYERFPYPHTDYTIREHFFNTIHDKLMKNILSLSDLKDNSLNGLRVLDAGCGSGEKAIYCALNGSIVDAVDISQRSTEKSFYARGFIHKLFCCRPD